MRERIFCNYMDRAIGEFDANPLARELLRRLANELPDFFFSATVVRLQTDGSSAAYRFITVLVMRCEELMDYLVNPATTPIYAAVKLLKRFLAVDPSFDTRLAMRLPDRSQSNFATSFDAIRATRALEILDQTSRGARLLPILSHLVTDENPRLAAKATLFIGRRIMNPAWTAKLLSSPENRIRANAVESLWGMKTTAAVGLLENCLQDPYNRVVGNALVGLHAAGCPAPEEPLLELAVRGDPLYRSTGAWTMGKLASDRWIEPLTVMLKDNSPQVRSMALRSIREINCHNEVSASLDNLIQAISGAGQIPEPEAAPLEESDIILPELRLDGASFRVR